MTLDVSVFNGKHDSANIVSYVKSIASRYNIAKIHAIVTDGAPNNNLLSNICNYKYICIVHSINLLVNDLVGKFNFFNKMLLRINKLSKSLRMSSMLMTQLENNYKKSGEKFRTIPTYCMTRFNSCYRSFNSLLKIKKSLLGLNYCVKLSPFEWRVIEEILPFFKFLNDSYNTLSNETKSTSCFIYPILVSLKKVINGDETDEHNELNNDSDDELELFVDDYDALIDGVDDYDNECYQFNWREYLIERFELRFNDIMGSNHVIMACFLNPSTRDSFLSPSQMDECLRVIFNNSNSINTPEQPISMTVGIPIF